MDYSLIARTCATMAVLSGILTLTGLAGDWIHLTQWVPNRPPTSLMSAWLGILLGFALGESVRPAPILGFAKTFAGIALALSAFAFGYGAYSLVGLWSGLTTSEEVRAIYIYYGISTLVIGAVAGFLALAIWQTLQMRLHRARVCLIHAAVAWTAPLVMLITGNMTPEQLVGSVPTVFVTFTIGIGTLFASGPEPRHETYTARSRRLQRVEAELWKRAE